MVTATTSRTAEIRSPNCQPPNCQPPNCQPVEVRGQIRGVQLYPPEAGDGGTFQLMLEDGAVIDSPYPAEWHLEVAGALQACDVRRAIVTGIGEYSPDGRLQRISRIESLGIAWIDEWQAAVVRRIKLRADL